MPESLFNGPHPFVESILFPTTQPSSAPTPTITSTTAPVLFPAVAARWPAFDWPPRLAHQRHRAQNTGKVSFTNKIRKFIRKKIDSGLRKKKISTISFFLGKLIQPAFMLIKKMEEKVHKNSVRSSTVSTDHLLLDKSPNIGPLKSRWELDKFKNC
jgi:hypothetical protein